MHDPRVLFAAERTLLAWIRTGLTIMAFGFVVARFGLFLRIVRLQQSDRLMETNPQGLANVVGVALVLIGSACMVLAAVQHRGYISTVPAADIPRPHDPRYPIALALFLAIVGLILAAYLTI
jgi:putative membrane protein